MEQKAFYWPGLIVWQVINLYVFNLSCMDFFFRRHIENLVYETPIPSIAASSHNICNFREDTWYAKDIP